MREYRVVGARSNFVSNEIERKSSVAALCLLVKNVFVLFLLIGFCYSGNIYRNSSCIITFGR